MTSQTGKKNRSWHRTISGGAAVAALVAGLVAGVDTSTAFADPENSTTEIQAPVAEGPRTPCTGDDCGNDDADAASTMSADQALQIVATEYDTGAGGGQISNIIHDIMTLRAQGFRPSKANVKAIQAALEKRPNQVPLVEALKATLSYQRKLQAQMQNAVQGSAPVPVLTGPTPGPTPVPGGPQPGVGVTGPGGGGIVMPIG